MKTNFAHTMIYSGITVLFTAATLFQSIYLPDYQEVANASEKPQNEIALPTVRLTDDILVAANESIEQLNNAKQAYLDEQARIAYSQKTYQASRTPSTGSGNFRSDGVWYDENYRYTWYSSNALHHYRTSEWTAGSDNIYRDADGYVVVASSDYAQGTVIEDTPFGAVKVYDSGCASGTLDVYVNY